jgi:hypothetical protein
VSFPKLLVQAYELRIYASSPELKFAHFCLSFKYIHRTGREVVTVFGRLLYWNVRQTKCNTTE